MKIKVDFKHKNITNKIEKDFPFSIIHRLMDVTRWKYYDSPNTPTIDKIKNTLFRLVNDVKNDYNIGTGGFDVTLKKDVYNIIFTVASFSFTNKSEDWNSEDLEYLGEFIKKVELTEVILNSNLMMLKNSEKDFFFKRECDNFIESGSGYKYDKGLGLLYTKEEYDDESPLYTLEYIGVDKDFSL